MALVADANLGQPITPNVGSKVDPVPRYASNRHVAAFWQSVMWLGFGILAAESVAVLFYLMLTPSGQHRIVIATIAALTLGCAIVGISLAGRVAKTTWHKSYSLAVTLAAGIIVTICCALDGGIDSPLVYLIVVPVVSAALALPARHVAICAGAAIAEVCLLAVLDPDVITHGGALVLIFSMVVGVSGFAALTAVARTRLQTEDDRIHDELAHLIETDSLTGCLNHRAFNTRLSNEIDRFDRYGTACCLMIADVDLFKSYNDSHGHLAGDDMLAAIGSALMTASRRSDMVARIGGDEFAVILPSTSLRSAEEVANRLRVEINATGEIDVTLSTGVAAIDPAEPTVRKLFRDSDTALHLAKMSGRDRVVPRSSDPEFSDHFRDARSHSLKTSENGHLLEERMRQIERENAETGALMDAMLQTAPVGLCFVNHDYRILRINDALAQVLVGTDIVKTLKGQKVPDVVSPALWQQLEPVYERVFDNGSPVVIDDIVTELEGQSERFQYWHSTFFPVVLDDKITGAGVVAVDITDRRELQNAERHLIHSMVGALGAAVDARDPYTSGHQQSVALIATAIAEELGLEPKTIDEIELAARIHDLGKVRIPSEILARPGRLNAAEMALVREHPKTGDEILSSADFPPSIREMVFQHHERMNGTGYPQGLVGAEISLGARVIAVADVMDSMVSARPYRAALGHEVALAEITGNRGTLYDERVVDACLRIFHEHRLPLAGPRTALV